VTYPFGFIVEIIRKAKLLVNAYIKNAQSA